MQQYITVYKRLTVSWEEKLSGILKTAVRIM